MNQFFFRREVRINVFLLLFSGGGGHEYVFIFFYDIFHFIYNYFLIVEKLSLGAADAKIWIFETIETIEIAFLAMEIGLVPVVALRAEGETVPLQLVEIS